VGFFERPPAMNVLDVASAVNGAIRTLRRGFELLFFGDFTGADTLLIDET
jgi:hypothetical protein